ncbi:MAG: Asp-tRNA(Asn)/Glu-tRNA(Gln) amidotransferase subunit GatC [Candidatus Improbicoccus devescovinae]|nr:MAG: Asp-tRNA(Asn)/Glu-tRNA(Gln) amidotransferase subunit GatC [Candidatus Improbicoccus devescovinae]
MLDENVDITREKILDLAKLAKIRISEDEITGIISQMGNIIKFVNQISNVETHETSELYFKTKISTHLKDDNKEISLSQDDIFKNCAEKENGFFVVKI